MMHLSRLAAVSLLFLFGLSLLCAPLPIPPYLDFQVLYHADMGLLRGIPLYDRAAQAQMVARLAGVPPEKVFLLPFPYPPWYALATLPLALLPIEVAARLWFGINLFLLFLSTWLLTSAWPRPKRLLLFLLAVFFVPALGTLYVGQYTFPVLLGACLWVYAMRREQAGPLALASALLTFKPHLGLLSLALGMVSLYWRGDAFGRRALKHIVWVGLLLLASGFIADRAWPVHYVHSLLTFRGVPGVSSCELCASPAVRLPGLFHVQTNLALAASIGLLIFSLFVLWWGTKRRSEWRYPAQVMAASILATLLASPYLLNYDFVLLLVPFAVLMEAPPTPIRRLLLLLAYFLPAISFALWGRQGTLSLAFSALMLLAMQAAAFPSARERPAGSRP